MVDHARRRPARPVSPLAMRAYCFFSVHFELFDRVARDLVATGELDRVSGFAWGKDVVRRIAASDVPYDREHIVSFTEDVLPRAEVEGADIDWLQRREKELGISLRRAIAAERHLLAGRTYDEVLSLVQATLKTIDEVFERARPDFVFTEDISCLTSMLHWAVARERGIPFWCIGSARLPNRLSVYRSGFQSWERCISHYRALGELTVEQRRVAEGLIERFRQKPERPTGMETRSKRPSITFRDAGQLARTSAAWLRDRDDPTSVSPPRAVMQRITRLARIRGAAWEGLFEHPRAGERFVLYPIHFQPEASTLVQAPLYLNQLALIEDIARSLPVGVYLYVKEHLSNRGRRSLEFYRQIRSITGVRLLGPDEDTWTLIQESAAVAVITGTMGWEGLIFEKPVIVFGDVFYDMLPPVVRGYEVPKDGWHQMFADAIADHRPDRESLIRFVVAILETSFPGFMKNPNTFPRVLEEENVTRIAAALRAVVTRPPPPLVLPHHIKALHSSGAD